ncbi:MAG: Cof-type HAD-IIB family hydrolase [Eubacteriales bacterium]|nr:Cof-type HAD-IIB family hydrolase [Eubacteriales bacterium]
MSDKKKAVFFDIDGTLWDRQNYIPESTKLAIRELRANGHLVFLCSGRCRAFIRDQELLDLGFDGVIGGCGTTIEYNGEIIFKNRLDVELIERTLLTVRRYGFRPILEGNEYIYMDDSEFGKEDVFAQKLRAELGGQLLTISDQWGKWDVCKFSCATENADREACFAGLEGDYDFMIHNSEVVEIVPKGFHKGTGIVKMCEFLKMDTADTVAFGDSVNDLGMFRTAGIGIAMGNGSKEAKAAADYVTSGLYEDGIWKACRHFRLI